MTPFQELGPQGKLIAITVFFGLFALGWLLINISGRVGRGVGSDRTRSLVVGIIGFSLLVADILLGIVYFFYRSGSSVPETLGG